MLELVLINIRFDVADHFRVQLDEIVLLVALALNPRMVEGLLAGKPNVRGSLEQFCDQILRLVAHLLPHLGFHAVFAVEHIIDDVFVRFTAEGRLAAKHNVHDYTHRPDITLRRVTAFQNFRRDVVRCSVRLVHDFVRDNALCESKVDELDVTVVVLFVEQEVLRLDVTVANAVGV